MQSDRSDEREHRGRYDVAQDWVSAGISKMVPPRRMSVVKQARRRMLLSDTP
ncbi:hypothetical protein M419DRAFT_118106 [Trichoderma reesei RUT C-30]|uniref:Uncharacterized protein n=1 Tax=Hypocrea jecorina (strain ATCC 56765 / BCRC 32924 / NRRL 11460 / Rut C-30) TaxID=1344414 RepID=A0A024SEP4_HYPJR|nr:hypothetical protein M419DRAFT_118106 [Trichoderma reesei RUT C-30]